MKQFKTCCLILMLLLLVCVPATALAAEGGIAVQLDGSNLNFTDATPVNENGRVYVPFRAVFEGMNATVDYAAETSTITATKGDTTVQFVIGNTDITVNGKTINNDEEPYPLLVFRDVTYFPLTWRFAVDEFGLGLGTAAVELFVYFGTEEAEFLAVFVDGDGFLADPFVDGRACRVVRVVGPEFVDVHPRVFGRCACCVDECAYQGLETADFLF